MKCLHSFINRQYYRTIVVIICDEKTINDIIGCYWNMVDNGMYG